MKLLIKAMRDDSAIMIDSTDASEAAMLLAGAVLVKSDGWGENKRWSVVEDGNCSIEFVKDEYVQAYTEREKRLEKQLSDKNSEWYAQYSKADKAEKRVKELEAQISLMQSVTVCEVKEQTVSEPEIDTSEDV